jgi:hypothetical protein|tara:strand:+ start:989 stop:1255 length:267 start_codon:yes stop_codon:yes gene_type:complete
MAKKFNANKYGSLWSSITTELMKGAKATTPQGEATQPLIGTLLIGGKRHELTWSETNRIIEELYDLQTVAKNAQRMDMLGSTDGTWRG